VGFDGAGARIVQVFAERHPESVAARDLKRFAQCRYAVLPSIFLNEGVHHFASRAK